MKTPETHPMLNSGHRFVSTAAIFLAIGAALAFYFALACGLIALGMYFLRSGGVI